MKLKELLSELSRLNVKVFVDKDQLCVRAKKGVVTQELRDSLKKNETELLSLLNEKGLGQNTNRQSIQKTDRSKTLPLSYAQELIWSLSQTEAYSYVYNLCIGYRLSGNFDITLLGPCINEVIKRHEILRTDFPVVDGNPIQRISDTIKVKITKINLEKVPQGEQEAEAHRIAKDDVKRPISLEQAPLFRVNFIRLSEKEYILTFIVHHIIFDGWSLNVLNQELTALYEAYSTGGTSLLEVPIQYADYAVWQQGWFRGNNLTQQIAYWKEKLAGSVQELKLPARARHNFSRSLAGERQSFTLSKGLSDNLKKLIYREDVTLFAILFSAFKTLMFRYTGQEDMIMCSPEANRNHRETQSLIGYFNNLLILRMDLSGNPLFTRLLKQVSQGILEASRHQDVPFQILAESDNLTNTRLTKGMFNLRVKPKCSLKIPDLYVDIFEVYNGTADFDLSLVMEDKGKNLAGFFEYRTEIIDATIIKEFITHFRELLENICDHPDLRIADRKYRTQLPEEKHVGNGEIETVLTQHPQIDEAVIIATEKQADDTSTLFSAGNGLIAYVVSNQEQPPTVDDLRKFLKQKLPEYTIPIAFVPLEGLPLKPNGRIDREKLPLPELESLTSETFVAPRNPVEEELATIWENLLKVKKVGIHDNFFELGGHSLLATQVISRLRKAFSPELPLRSLFENPTVAGLGATIKQASNRSSQHPLTSIEPLDRQEQLPLSFAQQRLWFLDQLEGQSATYNIASALQLTGKLNFDALEKTVQTLFQRHETLRTCFRNQEGTTVQIIVPKIEFTLPISDLEIQSEKQQVNKVEQLTREESKKSFDLTKAPLIRVSLLRLSPQSHILLLTMHHIISDGWSMGIFWWELSVLYEAYNQGKASPLPELPIQYVDFAAWQRAWLQGETFDHLLSYWKEQLGGAPPVLALPMDNKRPAIQTYRGATEFLLLPEPLSDALRTLGHAQGVTLYMTLLSAFKVLLSRYTGSDDIVVGSPIAGRNQAEAEPLVGFFINTLVLRTHLSGNPSFQELLGRVREVTLGAFEHQEMPFEKLVEELHPERSLSYTPLFQVWFNMLNLESKPLDFSGLEAEFIAGAEEPSKFDLSLYIKERAEGIELRWVYNLDLFNPETIKGMVHHFQTMLEDIIADPKKAIGNLSLFNDSERQLLKQGKNQVSPNQPLFKEFPKTAIEQSIPQRFNEQVNKFPHHLAIQTECHQWTYEILNNKVNGVAQTLLKLGGNASQRIALLLDHDAPMIAALLGVLKVGKTYVPLDPTYPKERLTYILEECQVSSIITNTKNLSFAEDVSNQTIKLLNLDEIDLEQSWEELRLAVSPDSIAYLLYTSGSTGQPKGVIQNHRNVLHFIRNHTNNLQITSEDKLTLVASYCFDAAVIDIFGALLNGAALFPIKMKAEGLTNLDQYLTQNEISIYHSTPSLYRNFLGTADESTQKKGVDFKNIRLVVLGGEEMVKRDVDIYRQYFSSDCILVNGFGSTESSFNSQYLMNHETAISRDRVPIGYPFDDTEIVLLDEGGGKAEIYGEIAIRSPHIALGYWQNLEFTRAVFLEDPERESGRIYRTGDLGRFRPDGTLEFCGRKDFQVKIRGFRVELGEIETNLTQHPQINDAVVIVSEKQIGDTSTMLRVDKQIIAYLVSNQGPTPSVDDLKEFLKPKLPEYMIPSAFVPLETLPLTPNGKIDRKALPISGLENLTSETFVAPRSPIEKEIVTIWEKILGLDQVGIRHNFFELGGHSLLATQVISRIQGAFSLELPLRILFETPTIAELAQKIETNLWVKENYRLLPGAETKNRQEGAL